jgi:hypothetical protein
MKWAIGIIVIVVVCVLYVLISGKYKQDETSEDKSKIGWGEAGEAGSDDGGDD